MNQHHNQNQHQNHHQEDTTIVSDQIITSGSSSVDNGNRTSSSGPQHENFLSMPLWGGRKVDDDEFSLFDDVHNQFSAIRLTDNHGNIEAQTAADKESKMRSEMTKLLEMCLRAQDNKCDMKPSQSQDTIRKLARALEKRLYKSAISFESYCDLRTLESRMRVVLYHLRKQKSKREKRTKSVISHQRKQLLQQLLGFEEYTRAEWLVHEIYQRKTSLAGQNCGQCQIGSKSCPTPRQKTQRFGEHLPNPVKDLIFRTPLLDIFSKYALERIQSLTWHHLQRLMEQAERHLEEYDAYWKMMAANDEFCTL